MVKDAQKYAEELGMKLELRYPDPSGTTAENGKIEGCKNWNVEEEGLTKQAL